MAGALASHADTLLAGRSARQAQLARAVLERVHESLIERWSTLERWLIGVNGPTKSSGAGQVKRDESSDQRRPARCAQPSDCKIELNPCWPGRLPCGDSQAS